jgi:hypothetical protein
MTLMNATIAERLRSVTIDSHAMIAAVIAAAMMSLSLTANATADEPDDYTELCTSSLQDCFTVGEGPGCNDPACCKLVCSQVPECCDGEWNEFCVHFANELCTPLLPCPAEGSCFEEGGDGERVGCDDESCCQFICALDPFCCSTYWDLMCVQLAISLCNAESAICELPPPGDDEIPEPEECAERLNEGCNRPTDLEFIPIGCGDKYRGSVYAGAPRDTDWYLLVVDKPGEFTWTVTSEFPSIAQVMSGECEHALHTIVRGYGGECEPISLTFYAEPGEYFLFIAAGTPAGTLRRGVVCPDDKADDPPQTIFGIEYIAHLTGEQCDDDPECGLADLNCDGTVNVADLLILFDNWGECADCTPGACPADLNGDCLVNVADLLILFDNWG